MNPKPIVDSPNYIGAKKLDGKVALITGGDSGIGKSVAILYAKEGADVAIVYLNEDLDAQETQKCIEAIGKNCLLIKGDISDELFCKEAIHKTVAEFGGIDILVNNAGEHYESNDITDISTEQLEKIFRINIFSMFYLTKATLEYLKPGSAIINTTSVTAYRGSAHLIDYASTKGAIVAFTRSLSESLVKKGIRVNGVAPGPIWTPLIPSSFAAEKVEHFGQDQPMGRPGQPIEVAPCYVFLASADSSYMSGQILHPNGGEIINS